MSEAVKQAPDEKHLAIVAGQYSHQGAKARNEDCCGVRLPERPLLYSKGVAAVVADGVSSSEGGRQASETCVQGFLADYYSTPDSWGVKTSVQKVLSALNRWLHGQGHAAYGHARGMISTMSVIIIKSNTAHVFHVGDTRIYRFRDRALECLTRDHQTWGAEGRAFLNRAMGADIHVDIDYRKVDVAVGDVFVLTSDGVHGFISDGEIRQLLRQHGTGSAENCARLLAAKAMENRSDDNITCQILQVRSLPDLDEKEFYHRLQELPFPPPLQANMVMDGLRIIRELHASKRTQVYLARIEADGRRVVLKTPSVNFEDDPEYIEHFLREEWAGRRINNDHVLAVVPMQQKKFLYYLTEYIEGQTLRHWMHEHPKPCVADILPLVEQVISGLRAFHRLDMYHQDIKPENIMIDRDGLVKIVDFGSVRIAGIGEIVKPVEDHHVRGTLGYTAPEIFRGELGDKYADLYSLGAVVYEMLTAMPPFPVRMDGRRKQAAYRSICLVNDRIPAWVDKAVEKALHHDPRFRQPALSEFLADLKRPNPAYSGQAVPLLERNPLLFWKTLSLSLLLLVLVLCFLLVSR